tara:strand:- start:1058 stop:1534 length:477 start_codon:yes stop_codon:yes gene_type:complete
MALNLPALKSTLMSGFGKYNPSGYEAARIITNGLRQYTNSLMDPAGGNFVSMSGLQTLTPQLANIFERRSPSGGIIGSNVARKINQCFMTLTTNRFISVVTVPAGLISDLRMIFQKYPPQGSVFGENLSQAINNYTINITITAIIPGSPPVVVSGPPS